MGETLLEPTVVYVRAVRELLESAVDVRGLAHITGEGFLNLLRLEAEVGYRLDALPEPPAVFRLIAERGQVEPAELYEVFNMGCGFCCVVPAADGGRGRGAARRATIPAPRWSGEVTPNAGVVELPAQGLVGRRRRRIRARLSLGRLPEHPGEHPQRARAALRPQAARAPSPPPGSTGRRRPPPPRWPASRSAAARPAGPGAAPRRARRRRPARRRATPRRARRPDTRAVAGVAVERGSTGASARRSERGLLQIGAEGLHDRVRLNVHAKAGHVEAGLARHLHQRLGRVELAAEAHQPLADRPQVALGRLGALLGRRLDRHAGGKVERIGPSDQIRGSTGIRDSAACVEPVLEQRVVYPSGPAPADASEWSSS